MLRLVIFKGAMILANMTELISLLCDYYSFNTILGSVRSSVGGAKSTKYSLHLNFQGNYTISFQEDFLSKGMTIPCIAICTIPSTDTLVRYQQRQ